MNPRELGRRERALLKFYQNCRFGLSPQEFRNRYDLTYAEIGALCGISLSSVKRLFARPPKAASPDLVRTLAIVDLLLRDQIPPSLIRQLCPPENRNDDQKVSS